jgi:hypothetical protein
MSIKNQKTSIGDVVGNLESTSLVMEVKNSATTVEKSMSVSQKCQMCNYPIIQKTHKMFGNRNLKSY